MGDAVSTRGTRPTTGDAVIVTDVGQQQMFSRPLLRDSADSRSVVTSGGLGTMGFGLPAAIGAKLGAARPRGRPASMGDGGLQMTIQELGDDHAERASA